MIGVGVSISKIKRLLASTSEFAFGGFEPSYLLDFVNDPAGAQSRMTHDRGGNAMMRDAQGRWVWAPHNLLTWGEDFSNADWLKSNATISGTDEALVIPDTGSRALNVDGPTQSLVSLDSNLEYTASAEFVSASARYGVIGLSNGGGYTATVAFDLVTGEVSGSGHHPACVSSLEGHIQALGDDRFLCTLKFAEPVSLTKAHFTASTEPLSGVYNRTITGDGASGVYIRHARFYRSDLPMADNPATGNSYVPTTDAPVYLPRIGHHEWEEYSTSFLPPESALGEWVNKGLLVEEQATNHAIYFNDFASWGAAATLTPAATEGPSGKLDATLIQAETSDLNRKTLGISSWPATQALFSVSVKPHSITRGCRLLIYNNTTATTLINQGFTLEQMQEGVPEANGFYRISTFADTGITVGDNITVYIYANDANEIGEGHYFWGAQVTVDKDLSSPIPTNGAAVTRLADEMPQPAGTLPWPAPEVIGPELVVNGTFDSNLSGWSSYNSGAVWSDGAIEVDHALAASGAYQVISTEAGKTYLATADVVAANGFSTAMRLRCGDGTEPNAGIADSDPITELGPTSVIFTAVSSVSYVYLRSGNDYVTSWDNVSVREIKPLALTIGMAGEVRYSDDDTGLSSGGGSNGAPYFYLKKLGSSDFIGAGLDLTSSRTGQFVVQQRESASGLDSVTSAIDLFSPGLNVPFAFCATHASTPVAAAVNGVALMTNTTPTALPDLSATEVELLPTFNGTVEWIAYWAEDIGDAGRLEGSSYGA